jgi:hypothetical protein
MGNFSRYVRPGAVRHGVSGVPASVRVLAFTRAQRWTVIVIDDAAAGSAPVALRLALPAQVQASTAVHTTSSANLTPAALPRSDGDRAFVTQIAAESVTTYSFAAPKR